MSGLFRVERVKVGAKVRVKVDLGGFGWFWVVLGGFGWFWVVLGGFW